jgi:hypothetical protein
MDWSGLWSSVLSNLVWWLLFVGGSALLGWLRAKKPQIAGPVLYGLAGATCLGILWFTFTGHAILSKQLPQITPDNIEGNVRKWADSLGMSVARMPQVASSPDVYFGILVTLQNGTPIYVFREKEKPGYLQMQTPLALSPEHLALLNKLTPDEENSVSQEVLLEVARTRMGYQVMTASGQQVAPQSQPMVLQQTIVLMEGVPIGNELTEAAFAQHANELDSAVMIVRASTVLTLQRYSRLHDSEATKVPLKRH